MQVKILLIVLVQISWQSALAQQIKELKATQSENVVNITFNLDGEKGKAFLISIFSSHNKFSTPLEYVEGDVAGKRVLPGPGKSIQWDAQRELKNFDGDLSFEIRATPAPPLFTDIHPSESRVKKGSKVTITWKGRIKLDVIVFLVSSKRTIQVGEAKDGKVMFTLDKRAKSGDYQIVLRCADEEIAGEQLSIVPKLGLGYKLLIGAALVGTAIVVTKQEFPPEKLIGPPDLTN